MQRSQHSSFRRALALVGITSLVLMGVVMRPADAHEDHGDDSHPVEAAVAATCGDGVESILVLEETLASRGCGHVTVAAAVNQGFSVDIVDDAAWQALSTDDFASYRAVVLADPHCQGGTSWVDAAEATVDTWTPAVTGNVMVIGTDEEWHASQGGAALTDKGIAFVTADGDKTGAYISLSCYYHGTSAGTPVPVLDGFGAFEATGVGCYNDAHIVAEHPALDGLTDATLSNWSCSVHEAFQTWPLSFEVLAIAENFDTTYSAPDGTVGTPYILARGVEVISDIDLAPDEAVREVGETHTLTATVAEDDVPVPGAEVTFSVIDGPHAGTTGTGTTNSDGVATFSYTGTEVGTDLIEASFVDSQDRRQRSNRVTSTWVADPCTADAGDGGLLTEDSAGQTLHDGGLGALSPVVGDPDHGGPLSGPVNDAGDDSGLEPVTDEVSCVASLPGPDGDAL